MTDAPRLVLASSSPRRRHLLARAGYQLEVVAPEVDELSTPNVTARELALWNALRKGLATGRHYPDAVVLAADTLVALGREIMGKPRDLDEARQLLHRLSGRSHIVVSGVFVGRLARGHTETFAVLSRVVFRNLSEQMVDDYVARIDPLDKAGAYAAQGEGRSVVTRIVGSRSNVIGLPMERTRSALRRFGILPLPGKTRA